MKEEAAAPSAHHGLWSRRWFRRVTCLIAAGVTLTGLTAWALTRPQLDRWLIAQLDHYSRQELGLPVSAERLEIHPFQGRILLHQVTLGGDLARAGLLELDLEWGTLLHTPHLRRLLIQDPVLNLDRARLARIRLKPQPENSSPLRIQLDRLELHNGQAHVRETAWGLPQGDCSFEVTGQGWTANQLQVQARLPWIGIGQGAGRIQGDLALSASLTDQRLDLDQGRLRLGTSQVLLKGGYRYRDQDLDLEAQGQLDLVQAQLLAGQAKPAASGRVAFQTRVRGPLLRPAWDAKLQGLGLQAKDLPMHPGNLHAALQGDRNGIRLEQLAWASADGRLEASGSWTARAGYVLRTSVSAVALAPVAGYTRAGFLKDLSASFSGEARLAAGLPQAPFRMPDLERLSFHGTGQFTQAGRSVGSLALDLEHKQFQAPLVVLDLPELAFRGKASGRLGQHGIQGLSAEATAATDAADVAGMLAVWDIGMTDSTGRSTPLDMSGAAQVEAQVGWAPETGLQLQGRVEIQDPRWHGARADRVRTDVSIDRNVLRLSGIELDKDAGKGYGDLWLTWANLPHGAEQIDMHYRADHLPVREGLRAADIGDMPLDGTGTGWVRLHGPFDRILMEGHAQAEQAEVYGMHLPAVSADFFMDITGNRLRTTDVRVADSAGHLGDGPEVPSGPLALRGSMDMDIARATWQVAMKGAVDSRILGLPGPEFQAQVDAHLEGPFTAPLGPMQMPTGSLTVSQGQVTQSGETLEGLEGSARFSDGNLQVSLGLADRPMRLLDLQARQRDREHLSGSLRLEVGPESADTAQLATRLTQNFLKDAHFRLHAQGEWGPQGLTWQGQLDRFNGQFDGFYLAQAHAGRVSGDASGLDLALTLEGRTALAPGSPAVPNPASSWRGRAPAATSITLNGRVPFRPDAPLALKLAGSSNLTNLKTLLDRVIQPGQYSLLADLHPEGDAVFDLNLGGSFRESTLDGTLSLKGGRAVVQSYPLSVENLDFTARFSGRDITIPKTAPLRGNLAQGALTAWGTATWGLGGISSYDLHTSLEDFQLRDLPDGFDLQGSLDASLKGSDRDGGRLSGSIWARRTLYRTEINLADLILASALGPGARFHVPDPSDPLARIELDLELHMAEPWELDTNLLKLQGRPRGPFWIKGTLVQPGLQGRMELMPGGRLTNLFPAGDIVIEQGTVTFADPGFFNPNFDVHGQIDIPPYLVTLNLSGTLDALQARPFSTPSLRQDEIFAILIDPAAVTQVGGAQSGSSQTALNTGLASTSTGLLTSLALASFQEQLRRALSLDRVSVALRTGVGTPETSITLGKSVNLFGYHTPLVFTHNKSGEVTTISGQVEWRFGDFVFRLGASQSTADSLAPSGEVRHSWSPR